jgi:hypothetical protein
MVQGFAHFAFHQRHVGGFVVIVVKADALRIGVHHTDFDHFWFVSSTASI